MTVFASENGYARERVYGDKGQDTERVHPYIPTYILSEIQKIVAGEGTPFDTGHDFFRDALVHSIVWWHEQDGETNEGRVFKHRAAAQRAIAAQTVREQTVEFYERALRDARNDVERWDDVSREAEDAILTLYDYRDLVIRMRNAITMNAPPR